MEPIAEVNLITVAIIIPCYNVQDYVGDAISSAIAQTSSFDQIIIVDDGSTDNTWHEIIKFKDITGVEICKLEKNKGLGYARNFGAKHARTEFIMFMDSDDLIDANLILDFKTYAASNINMDVFAFSMLAFKETSQHIIYEQSHIYPEMKTGLGKDILAKLILENHFRAASWMYIFRNQLIDWEKYGFINILHEDEEGLSNILCTALME